MLYQGNKPSVEKQTLNIIPHNEYKNVKLRSRDETVEDQWLKLAVMLAEIGWINVGKQAFLKRTITSDNFSFFYPSLEGQLKEIGKQEFWEVSI